MLLSLGIATTIYSSNYKLYYAAMTVIQLDYFSFEILRQITKQLSLTIISTSIVASIEIVLHKMAATLHVYRTIHSKSVLDVVMALKSHPSLS